MSALPKPTNGDIVANGGKRREFAMSEADFRKIASMLCKEAGISLSPTKSELVYSRLAKRVRKLSFSNFRDYCAFVESEEGEAERKEFVTSLTTNVSHFFREPHHFETLEAEVLPALAKKARQGGRVRIWSAGCSNGQEPYSIAMSVLSLIPEAAELDIKILATDIDSKVLATARRGAYDERTVAPIAPDRKHKFLCRSRAEGQQGWAVAPALQDLISFKELNLLRPWPVKGPFDVIFCRNVVIYFDEATQQPLWGRFASVLADDGWLFIGHSERVTGPTTSRFENTHTTTYRFKERTTR